MITYTKNEISLMFMSQFDFITSAKFEKILEIFEEPKTIFEMETSQKSKIKDILKTKYELFLDGIDNFNEKEFVEALNKRNIYCNTILSDNYPDKLRNLKNPPYVLYYVGNLELVNTKSIAVVGSRSPSSYGKMVTEKFAKGLAENGITIVSGLATGIDKIAHEGALEVGGNTIAVMGGGFDHIFPAMNINLARQIANSGLILTEYYTTIKPTKYSFPTRNRIIACLSDGILIPEAKNGSGSLYTKDYADELGIDTYCVPGSILSEKSEVPNRLIKIGQAGCVTSYKDILKDLGVSLEKEKAKTPNYQLSIEESQICSYLADGEKDFEFLQEKTNYSAQMLNSSLTTLEIRGIIKKLAGNKFILAN